MVEEGAGQDGQEGRDPLDEPLRRSVAAGASKKLGEALDLHTVGDLLRNYPRTYLSLTELSSVDDLPKDELVTLVGEVLRSGSRPMNRKKGFIAEIVIGDAHGKPLNLTFFRRAQFHAGRLKVGTRAVFTGKVTEYRGVLQLAHPDYELLDEESELDDFDLPDGAREVRTSRRDLPQYRASEKNKLSSQAVRDSIHHILDTLGEVPDPIPVEVRARHGLMDLRAAFEAVHRPGPAEERDKGYHRLTFEEAFVLQTALARRRLAAAELPATPRRAVAGGLVDALDARLPFTLTAGQREVGEALAGDLAQTHPMHRLLQGEVGSGKTLVALRAMLAVVDSGGQAALLAPTEVLATQHHRSISAMLGDLALGGLAGGAGTRVTLLTGSMGAAQRRRSLLEAASGEGGIVVGTHALLADRVQFADLGLVVIDEQHRFGVEQRDALRAKGAGLSVPHLLVMTATPIPRTVAMTVFGDLEVSTLTELPAGRQPITTHVVRDGDAKWIARVFQRIREQADAGHQAFVVCPRIGELPGEEPKGPGAEEMLGTVDRRPPRSAVDTLDLLRARPELQGLTVELLHGRMPVDERDLVMRRFSAGEVQVLVATTVIEVGVDVPNATVMMIVDADRFGVSQLHQLRGRVGRGGLPGLCFMTTELNGGPARKRLEQVAGTLDGFELARVDLEHRKEGDVLGSAQSGVQSSLRLLQVVKDEKLIAQARQEAVAVVTADPDLQYQPALRAALGIWLDDEREAFLDRG